MARRSRNTQQVPLRSVVSPPGGPGILFPNSRGIIKAFVLPRFGDFQGIQTPCGMLVLNQKSLKQLSTLEPARKKQKVWRDLFIKLRADLEQLIDDTAGPVQQLVHMLASKVGHKKECMLLYFVLAWYRGHIKADSFSMEVAACESSFFGLVEFEVRSELVGKDISEMFGGVEKTINQFFRDEAGLNPDGSWEQPWAVGRKWVKVDKSTRKKRRTCVLLSQVNKTNLRKSSERISILCIVFLFGSSLYIQSPRTGQAESPLCRIVNKKSIRM